MGRWVGGGVGGGVCPAAYRNCGLGKVSWCGWVNAALEDVGGGGDGGGGGVGGGGENNGGGIISCAHGGRSEKARGLLKCLSFFKTKNHQKLLKLHKRRGKTSNPASIMALNSITSQMRSTPTPLQSFTRSVPLKARRDYINSLTHSIHLTQSTNIKHQHHHNNHQ